MWYIFSRRLSDILNKRCKLTSCDVQRTTKLYHTAFKPVSFSSMFRCYVQTPKLCRRVSSQVLFTVFHYPFTISSVSQIFSVLFTLFSCASLRHYFTLYFKLNFYSAKEKTLLFSTASFNNIITTLYSNLLNS